MAGKSSEVTLKILQAIRKDMSSGFGRVRKDLKVLRGEIAELRRLTAALKQRLGLTH